MKVKNWIELLKKVDQEAEILPDIEEKLAAEVIVYDIVDNGNGTATFKTSVEPLERDTFGKTILDYEK
jgi:hypothetical protein